MDIVKKWIHSSYTISYTSKKTVLENTIEVGIQLLKGTTRTGHQSVHVPPVIHYSDFRDHGEWKEGAEYYKIEAFKRLGKYICQMDFIKLNKI